MLKVTIFFGRPADEKVFEHHLRHVHAPLGARVPGISRIELCRLEVMGTSERVEPPYHSMVELYFEDGWRLREALASTACRTAVEDLARFATGGVTAMVSEIEEIPLHDERWPLDSLALEAMNLVRGPDPARSSPVPGPGSMGPPPHERVTRP